MKKLIGNADICPFLTKNKVFGKIQTIDSIRDQRIFFVENFEFCFQLSMFRSCFKKEFKEFETHPRDTLLAQRFDPIFWSNFHASQISF